MAHLNPGASPFSPSPISSAPVALESLPEQSSAIQDYLPRLPQPGNTMEQMLFEQMKFSRRLERERREKSENEAGEAVGSQSRLAGRSMRAFSGYVAPEVDGVYRSVVPVQRKVYTDFQSRPPRFEGAFVARNQPRNYHHALADMSQVERGHQRDASIPRGPRSMTDPRDRPRDDLTTPTQGYPDAVDRSHARIHHAPHNTSGYQGYMIDGEEAHGLWHGNKPMNRRWENGNQQNKKSRRRESIQHPAAQAFSFPPPQTHHSTRDTIPEPVMTPQTPRPSASDLFFGPAPSSSPITTYLPPGAPTTRGGLPADLPGPRINPLKEVDEMVAKGMVVKGQKIDAANLMMQSLGNELDFQGRVAAAGARGEITFMDGGRFAEILEERDEARRKELEGQMGKERENEGQEGDGCCQKVSQERRESGDAADGVGTAKAATRVKAWDMKEWKIAGERRWDERDFKVMGSRRTRSIDEEK